MCCSCCGASCLDLKTPQLLQVLGCLVAECQPAFPEAPTRSAALGTVRCHRQAHAGCPAVAGCTTPLPRAALAYKLSSLSCVPHPPPRQQEAGAVALPTPGSTAPAARCSAINALTCCAEHPLNKPSHAQASSLRHHKGRAPLSFGAGQAVCLRPPHCPSSPSSSCHGL